MDVGKGLRGVGQAVATLVGVAALILFMVWMLGWFNGANRGEVDANESPEPEAVVPTVAAAEPVASRWTCDWSPTMNDNWHDDVLCSNGSATDRPILLAQQSFVSQDDMMQAARDYEVTLNG